MKRVEAREHLSHIKQHIFPVNVCNIFREQEPALRYYEVY
jgi:hypothetical protein